MFKPNLTLAFLWPLFILLTSIILKSPFWLALSLIFSIYAYLDWKFTSLSIINNEILFNKGIINKINKQISQKQINNYEISQNLFQRLFNTGTLTIFTGNDKPLIVKNLNNIKSISGYLHL